MTFAAPQLLKSRGVTESEWLVNSDSMIEIGWGRDWDASVLLLMPDDLDRGTPAAYLLRGTMVALHSPQSHSVRVVIADSENLESICPAVV